jgi:hypothetical protein
MKNDPIIGIVHKLEIFLPIALICGFFWIFVERRIVKYLRRKLNERRKRPWFSKRRD